MIRQGKIGTFEAVSLTTILIITKIFYTSPGSVTQKTGTAGWYMTIISCVTTIVAFFFCCILMKRFPGKNIVQIFDILLGKFLGKALGVFLSAFVIFECGSNVREFTEMIKAYILPYTPTSFIIISMLLASVLLSYYGLETIARVSAIGFVLVLLGLAAVLLLGASVYDASFLKPYLGYGLTTTIKYGLLRSSSYMEFFVLPVIILSLPDFKTFKRIGYTSILLAGAVFLISMLCYLMTFGYLQGKENMAGLFEMARSIYINRFVERVESIFLFSWVISSVISVAISFYTSVTFYCIAFKIKNHRPLLLHFALLVYIAAFLPQNMSDVIDINIYFLRQFPVFFIHTLPLALLLVAIIRRKKGGKAAC